MDDNFRHNEIYAQNERIHRVQLKINEQQKNINQIIAFTAVVLTLVATLNFLKEHNIIFSEYVIGVIIFILSISALILAGYIVFFIREICLKIFKFDKK